MSLPNPLMMSTMNFPQKLVCILTRTSQISVPRQAGWHRMAAKKGVMGSDPTIAFLTDRMVTSGMEVEMAADMMAIPIAPARQTRTTR